MDHLEARYAGMSAADSFFEPEVIQAVESFSRVVLTMVHSDIEGLDHFRFWIAGGGFLMAIY